jgi:phytoene synthase
MVGVDAALRRSYEACRRVNAGHGKTYYLATLLLPAWKRPSVHALYGFARYTYEIVDGGGAGAARRLAEWVAAFREGSGPGVDLLPAVRDTIARWEIPLEHFDAFLASMAMDLTVTGYDTHDDLAVYMHGSAAVIGLQMLPILGHPTVPTDVVAPYARDLGLAFQWANFIRDVGEDLALGRVYLPREDLDEFGVTRDQLAAGIVDARVRRLLAFEIARARELFRSAEPGIRLLDPTSRDCIRTAFHLYGGILDEVERNDYRVLDRRVSVGPLRRMTVAAPGLVRAARARRRAAPTRPTARV